MKRALFFAMLFVAALGARAESRVQAVATDPGAEVTLGRDEPFYVRMEYATDQPLKIWAHPFFRGKAVARAKTSPSLPHAGAGYALAWFSLDGAEAVDEVRIKVGGGKPYREWYASSFPVRLTGTGQPAAERSRPAWVDEMLREQERIRQASERQGNGQATSGGTAFMLLFMLAVLGLLLAGLGAPLWGVWKWRGVWRIAAAVPALIMTVVIVRIITDTAIDPTSHNLWPFEILIWGGACGVAMGLLALVNRLTRRA